MAASSTFATSESVPCAPGTPSASATSGGSVASRPVAAPSPEPPLPQAASNKAMATHDIEEPVVLRNDWGYLGMERLASWDLAGEQA